MSFPVSILATGSELLDGRVVDTNSNFVAQALSECGLKLQRVLLVDDDRSEHVAERPGDIQSLIARTEKATDLLNFCPQVDFATGVHNYVQWFKKQYANPAILLEADHRNWTLPA